MYLVLSQGWLLAGKRWGNLKKFDQASEEQPKAPKLLVNYIRAPSNKEKSGF